MEDIQFSMEPITQLASNQSTSLSYSFTRFWQLPPKLCVFTGRSKQLQILDENFTRTNQQLLIQHAPQITGSGGIGKTQLAVEFVHRLIHEKKISTVVWLNADTSISDQLNIEFIRLARVLGIDTTSLDKLGVINAVYRLLKEQPKVLIVLDSATSYKDLQPYLMTNELSLRFLVTTRDDQVWGDQFTQLPLDIFTVEEAVQYIKQVLKGREFDDVDVERLASSMGYFPLALAQATGYILASNLDIQAYLELFEQKKINRIKLLDKAPMAIDLHQETLWVTVNMSLERMNSPFAQSVLARIAYFAAEAPILSDFITSWSSTEECTHVLTIMRQYGLVSGGQENNQVRLHQMVQEVIRLSHDDEAMKEHLYEIGVRLVAYLISSEGPLDWENKRLIMMAHASSLSVYMVNKDFYSEAKLLNLFILLLCEIASAKHILGRFREVLEIGLMGEDLLAHLPDLNIDFKMKLYNLIGLGYQGLGDVIKALQYFEKILELEQQNQNNRLEPFTNTLNICGCYLALGKPHKAREIVNRIYEKILQADGQKSNEHKRYAMATMASIYRDLGEEFKALNLARTVVQLTREIYGSKHSAVATALRNLVTHCLDLDMNEASLELIQEALEITEACYGKDHLEVSAVLDIMGNVFVDCGIPAQACAIFQRALKIRTNELGENHPDVAIVKFNLANAELVNGNPMHAEQLLRSALLVQEQFYGNYNAIAGRTLHIMGNAYHDQGNYHKATESMNRAIMILSKNYSEMHREVAKVYNDISCVYSDMDQLDSAEKYSKKALEIFTRVFGECHVEIARTLNNLSGIVLRQGNLKQSIPYIEQAIAIFRTVSGPKHLDIAGPLCNLAMQYSKMKDHTKAKQLACESLEIYRINLGTEEHQSVAVVHFNLAKICVGLNEYTEAKKYCTLACNYFVDHLGSNHPYTIEALRIGGILASVPAQLEQTQTLWLDMLLENSAALDRKALMKLVTYSLQLQQPLLAIQFLTSLTQNDKNVRTLLVNCYLAEGDINSAMQCVNNKSDSDLVERIKLAQSKLEEANRQINAYNTSITLRDDDKVRKAQLFMKAFRFQEAVNLLNSIVSNKQSEHLAPAYYQLARCQLKLGNFQSARSNAARSSQIKAHESVDQLMSLINEVELAVPKLQRLSEIFLQNTLSI